MDLALLIPGQPKARRLPVRRLPAPRLVRPPQQERMPNPRARKLLEKMIET